MQEYSFTEEKNLKEVESAMTDTLIEEIHEEESDTLTKIEKNTLEKTSSDELKSKILNFLKFKKFRPFRKELIEVKDYSILPEVFKYRKKFNDGYFIEVDLNKMTISTWIKSKDINKDYKSVFNSGLMKILANFQNDNYFENLHKLNEVSESELILIKIFSAFKDAIHNYEKFIGRVIYN